MRLLSFLAIALTALSAQAAEPPATPSYPLWNGEPLEQYARRAKLPPTQTLDLGNGVKLELVLIPAGKFTMGTPEPKPVDEEGFQKKIVTGQAALSLGAGALLVLLGAVVIRAIRRRQRPQYSLAYLVVMVFVAGVGLLGGLHWYYSVRAFCDAKAEYEAAISRYSDVDNSEKPAHEVTLTKPFYIGKFEITQEQYQQVTGTNLSHFQGRDQPVENVSWHDAQEFCKKASEKTGLTVRLPTEAEWEHACRAGTKTAYYAGDGVADLDRAAWHYKNSNDTTHPVGQKAPNAWGLYDTHGNVWESCADWYGNYSAEVATDPRGSAQGDRRVYRGGCWNHNPEDCRSAYRRGNLPDDGGFDSGFRVVVDVPPKTR